MVEPGYTVFDHDPAIANWAKAALKLSEMLNTSERRHGGTWFVGVDALDNATDGSIDGVAWPHAYRASSWHKAQVSIVYPGYPQQDPNESDAAHRFRKNRDAAHMDGLLPEGPTKRRHLREPHAFIIGVPLNAASASPLVVWPGSHVIMRSAFEQAYRGHAPETWGDIDVTEIYQRARKDVFETCERIEVPLNVGQAIIVHRHLIHGVAPWSGVAPSEGRVIAYFRPILGNTADWL